MKFRVLILAFLAPCCVMAQDNDIKRNVTVERDYNPTTVNATKISPVPTKEDLSVESPVVTYSTWSTAEDVSCANEEAKADKYTEKRTADAKNGVAKVGLGFYWQALGEFYYPLLHSNKYLLDINLKHLSNWAHNDLADGTSPRAANHNTRLNMNFESQFTSSRLYSGVDVSYNGFDYYGLSKVPKPENIMKDTTGVYTTVGFNIGLKSTNPYSTFSYDFGGGYHYFGRNFGIAQHNIFAEAEIGGEVGEGELGAEIEIDVDIKKRERPAEKPGERPEIEREAGALITLAPFYKMRGNEWSFKIGGKMFIHCEKGTRRPITGSADLEGSFGLVPELLYLNAGIGGYFSENMYYDVFKENKYIANDVELEPTYCPLDVNLGLKVNIMKGLLFEAGGRYTLILDQYYFVNSTINNKYINTFDVVYDGLTNKVSAELGLYFTYVKDLKMSVKGKYNFWGLKDLEYAWQRPSWEVNFDANYTIKKKWRIGLSYNFLGGRYALIDGQAVKMKNVHDLNIYFSYQVLDFLEIFANGKNLANVKADSYYGYTSMGINGMIGATFRF